MHHIGSPALRSAVLNPTRHLSVPVCNTFTGHLPTEIADLDVRLPEEIGLACREAENAITRFDGRYGGHLDGLATFLMHSNAVAYAWVKRVNADLDDLARASIAAPPSPTARAMARASSTLEILTKNQAVGGTFSEAPILLTHEGLFAGTQAYGRSAGRYRSRQYWSGGPGLTRPYAVHAPPPASEVRRLMADLVRFVNRNDLPPLAQAAIAHGQFEAIHPFGVGNGRIGRALIPITMRRRAVARQVVAPIGTAMVADVGSYFGLLRTYHHGNLEATVSYVNRAAMRAVAEAAVSAERLLEMPDRWRDEVRPRARSGAAALIKALTATPVLDGPTAERLTGRSAPRTYEALDRLTEVGVLRETTGAERYRVWVAADVLAELEDLGTRIRQRCGPIVRRVDARRNRYGAPDDPSRHRAQRGD